MNPYIDRGGFSRLNTKGITLNYLLRFQDIDEKQKVGARHLEYRAMIAPISPTPWFLSALKGYGFNALA